MSRAIRREKGSQFKKLSDKEAYTVIARACDNYGNELMRCAIQALNEEYGFGKKRIDRFIDATNRLMKEPETK